MDESINDNCLSCYYKAASTNAAYNGRLVNYYLGVTSTTKGLYTVSVIKSTDELLAVFKYFEKSDILNLIESNGGSKRQTNAFKFSSVRQAQAFLGELAKKYNYKKCYL